MFVQRFDEALASGDVDRVAAMMTPQSRQLFWTMQRTPAADPPDPVTAVVNKVGHAGFVPTAPRVPAQFVSAHRDVSGIVLRVQAGDDEREWVVQERGGVLLLDLLATSSRSTWTGL